jgi:hypothetical protein
MKSEQITAPTAPPGERHGHEGSGKKTVIVIPSYVPGIGIPYLLAILGTQGLGEVQVNT